VAFSDPQTITIAGTAIPAARVFTGTRKGEFKSGDGRTRLELDPKSGKRVSAVARLYQTKTTADPLVGSVNVEVGDMVSLSINRPATGYTDAEILDQVTGFLAWLTAGTNANLKKLISGEN